MHEFQEMMSLRLWRFASRAARAGQPFQSLKADSSALRQIPLGHIYPLASGRDSRKKTSVLTGNSKQARSHPSRKDFTGIKGR